MGKFEKRFDDYVSHCYVHLTKKHRIEIKRIFYAGALEIIDLFQSTSEENGDQEVTTLADEVKSWCSAEADKILRELSERKKRN